MRPARDGLNDHAIWRSSYARDANTQLIVR
jgi:hypothetical protein